MHSRQLLGAPEASATLQRNVGKDALEQNIAPYYSLILGLILGIFRIFLQKNTKNNKFLQVEPLAPFGRVDFGDFILGLILAQHIFSQKYENFVAK